jgi:hypothetical protein
MHHCFRFIKRNEYMWAAYLRFPSLDTQKMNLKKLLHFTLFTIKVSCYKKQTPWPLVRERTIPTDRPPVSCYTILNLAFKFCTIKFPSWIFLLKLWTLNIDSKWGKWHANKHTKLHYSWILHPNVPNSDKTSFEYSIMYSYVQDMKGMCFVNGSRSETDEMWADTVTTVNWFRPMYQFCIMRIWFFSFLFT